MQKILQEGAVLGLPLNQGIFNNLHKFKCVTCFRSKLTKPFHQGSLITEGAVGKYFGCDVYGPIAVPSILGNTFVYGIIEIRSKHAWLFFRKNKNVSSCIDSFLNEEIICLRADNPNLGIITFVMDNGETKSAIIEKLMLSYNIVQQYTTYNTPEYNAIIKRFWRTLVEMATAILLDSELPDTYWEDAMRCALYMYNRIPPVRVPEDVNDTWQSPRERLYKNGPPTLGHLLPFGSRIVAFIPKELRGLK